MHSRRITSWKYTINHKKLKDIAKEPEHNEITAEQVSRKTRFPQKRTESAQNNDHRQLHWRMSALHSGMNGSERAGPTNWKGVRSDQDVVRTTESEVKFRAVAHAERILLQLRTLHDRTSDIALRHEWHWKNRPNELKVVQIMIIATSSRTNWKCTIHYRTHRQWHWRMAALHSGTETTNTTKSSITTNWKCTIRYRTQTFANLITNVNTW